MRPLLILTWTFSSKTSNHFVNSTLTIVLKIFRFCPSFYNYFTNCLNGTEISV